MLERKCIYPENHDRDDLYISVNLSNKTLDRGVKEMNSIKDFKTCELVEELKQREGVEYDELQPYVEKDLGVISGPAIVLTVID